MPCHPISKILLHPDPLIHSGFSFHWYFLITYQPSSGIRNLLPTIYNGLTLSSSNDSKLLHLFWFSSKNIKITLSGIFSCFSYYTTIILYFRKIMRFDNTNRNSHLRFVLALVTIIRYSFQFWKINFLFFYPSIWFNHQTPDLFYRFLN